MKYLYLSLTLIFALALSPLQTYAASVKFSSFTVEIPDTYGHKTGNSGIEIYDPYKTNVIIIFALPEVGQDLSAYSAELLTEYKGEDLDFDEESQVYYFTFKDADFDQCDAIIKEVKKRFLFITYGGPDKETMIEIVNSIK